MQEFGTENRRAIAAPAKSAGTPNTTPHALGSVVNNTTAHCTPTITTAVPSARARLPPIRVTSWVCRATLYALRAPLRNAANTPSPANATTTTSTAPGVWLIGDHLRPG